MLGTARGIDLFIGLNKHVMVDKIIVFRVFVLMMVNNFPLYSGWQSYACIDKKKASKDVMFKTERIQNLREQEASSEYFYLYFLLFKTFYFLL